MATPAVTDVAALAVAFCVRLRGAGVEVSHSAAAEFARAVDVLPPTTTDRLYWAARLTLVRRHADIAGFDAVFAEVFGRRAAPLALEGRRAQPAPTPQGTTRRARGHGGSAAPGTPAALVARIGGAPERERSDTVPDPRPSAGSASGTRPFAPFDDERVRAQLSWLDGIVEGRRRTRRSRPHPSGRRIALRETIARSRRTGWEPMRIVRTRPVVRPRRVVVVCDVSRSMLPFVDDCLHLMRAAALRHRTRIEVFAFSTALTRLTAVLAHRSADAALAHANATVTDRFGGTHIAGSLRALLASHHGRTLRGAIVVIVSDGWDSDPPESLAAVTARLHRRAHRVVWLNPRADAPGYRPLVGSLAAALPHVDDMQALPT
ncbi:VWA domain-containing protein [Rhodococcus sp. NPDC003318]|uniref:vWA domain-containing protein n=1 Tax=Rhodococcus sp. NPDC003318 TaxID=3364503 RepID=UPI0036AFCFD3